MTSTAASNPRRALLMARLAAERANLFFQMRGFDADSLATVPISNGWTVKDVLPHLAYWDAFYANRISLLQDGRHHDIRPLEEGAQDERNCQTRAQFADAPFEQALAIGLKERQNFLAVLQQMPDALLYRRFYLGKGWRASGYTWTRWRYQHDAEHAAEIGRCRTTMPAAALKTRPAPRGVLRSLLQATRAEFLTLAALVKPTDRETRPLCEHWTLKDIITHLAVFEQFGVSALKQLLAGAQPRFELTIANFDTFNEAQIVSRQGIPWARTFENQQLTRRSLLSLLAEADDELLALPFAAPWGSLTTGYRLLVALAVHEQEHSDVLRRSQGLPRLPKRSRLFR